MGNSDQNSTSEQKRPTDVNTTADDAAVDDNDSIAPTFAKPADEKDASERPVVNPVTGGAL
ncbi:hypothetical protein [Rhizobium sp. 9140]|uniref:hypothetical protein n=1 Tax=Rhizobium sp. 9140 TaxID=1761900 RepID=UPI0007977C88|nr:hypothetical protein [Rhizobium sp. 9140]CZT35184.1 hypothetical protein GA0004734_00021960 [Rhizobium sp. 9140]